MIEEELMVLTKDEKKCLDNIIKQPKRDDIIVTSRYKEKVMIFRPETHEVLLLKWKTFKKNQRKGKELDSNWFDNRE